MHRHLKRNLDLEALRTIAIGFTVLAHIAFILSPTSAYWHVLEHARFGSGVDLFFCISGFIITRSIMIELPDRPSMSGFLSLAVPFWKRRAQRLLPAAVLWIAMAMLAAWFCGGDGTFPSLADQAKGAAAALFQYFNGYWLLCRAERTCGPLGAFWSLSLENQFYFVLPIAAACLTRRWLPVLFALGFLVQVAIPRNITEPGTLGAWVFRTDAICLGVVLAFWTNHYSYKKAMPTWLRHPLPSIFTLVTLCVLLAAFTSPQPWIAAQTGAVAVVSTLLVWIASYDEGFLVSSRTGRAVVAYVGSRSYSIYLSHLFAMYVILDLWRRRGWLDGHHDAAAVAWFLALTWLMSEASYRFVERPLMPRRRATTDVTVATRADLA